MPVYCELFHYVTFLDSHWLKCLMSFREEFPHGVRYGVHISFTCTAESISHALFLRANVHIPVDCYDTMQIGFCFIIQRVCFLIPYSDRCLPACAPLRLYAATTKTHTQTNFLQGTSKLKSGDKWHRICVLLVRLYKELTLNILNV